jgi:hypothetical protein
MTDEFGCVLCHSVCGCNQCVKIEFQHLIVISLLQYICLFIWNRVYGATI